MKYLAEKYHNGQFRKSNDESSCKVPYIVHPQMVAETLLEWGEEVNSTAVMTAWGHDLLEDTCVTEDEIIAASNKDVLSCIKELTHDGICSKDEYLQHIAENLSRDVVLVKAADRICNTKDFISLKGELYAFRYFHQADCIASALKKISTDKVVQKALEAWETLDNQLEKVVRREIIRGCMLGGAVGDALGSPVEFFSIRDIKSKTGGTVTDYIEFGDGTGSITDDTQMTLFTVEGILRGAVRSNEKGICGASGVVHYAYLRWLKTQVICVKAWNEALNSGWLIKEKQLFARRAPGMTCISALKETPVGETADNHSKGCGTVMRMAPVGLYFSPETAYELGCEFSAITHGHPTGITAGGAFAMIISYLRYGKSLNETLDLVEKHLEKLPDASETLTAIRHSRIADSISELGEGWVAEEALAIGIYCALHYTWDFRAGVLAAVNISGDSDSTGAVAGNILGVINGESAIPEKWRKNLREYDIVSQVADDLCQEIETGEDGHVTERWWNKYPGF